MIFLFNALLACAALAQEAMPSRIEFEDLAVLVQKKNQHVEGAKFRLSAAEQRTGHIARSYLPVLDAQLGGERFNTGPFATQSQPFGSVEARWNLFRGGRDLLEERSRRAGVRASEAAYQQAYLEELSKARRAYWDLVYQRELLLMYREALNRTEQNLAAANKRVVAGLATETDRLEFEMYRTQLEQEIARVTLGGANAQRTLNVLLGRAENDPIETATFVPHQHDDAMLDASLAPESHRDVRALKANEEASRALKTQAYLWWTPSLDVYANYSLYTLRERDFEDRADRYETVGGVKLTFNLFDGLQSRAEAASLGMEAEGLSRQAAQTARELGAQFEGSKQQLRLMHDLIHSAERSVEQSSEYLKRTQSEYTRGVKNSPDVFSATEKYIDMKRRYAEIRRDYQLAKTDLLATLGK